jgi:hypothetical protein
MFLAARFLREDKLRQPVTIAQVNKDQAAMIAVTVNPPGKFDRPANIGDAKLATRMRAIARCDCVHKSNQITNYNL